MNASKTGSDYLANIIKHCGIDMTSVYVPTGSPTLTLSGAGQTAMNVIEMQWEVQKKTRDQRPLTFKQDALALSWASYWIYKRHPQRRWVDLTDLEAHDHDFEMAEATRKYYRDKLILKGLRGTQMTEFQKDLYEVCNGAQLTHGHLGMLYRLPYFYEEDLERQDLQSRYASHQPEYPKSRPLVEKNIRTLVPIKRILKSRARNEVLEFWLVDDRNQLVMWSVRHDNALRGIVESLCDKPSIDIEAFFQVHRNREGFTYFMMGDPRLA